MLEYFSRILSIEGHVQSYTAQWGLDGRGVMYMGAVHNGAIESKYTLLTDDIDGHILIPVNENGPLRLLEVG